MITVPSLSSFLILSSTIPWTTITAFPCTFEKALQVLAKCLLDDPSTQNSYNDLIKGKCNSSDGTQLHLTKPSPKYLRCTWILFHCSDLSRIMPSIKSLTNITHHTSWTHKHQHIEFLGGNIDVFPRFPNLTSGIIVLKRVLPTTLSTGKLPYSMLLLLIYLIFHLLSRGICTSSKF